MAKAQRKNENNRIYGFYYAFLYKGDPELRQQSQIDCKKLIYVSKYKQLTQKKRFKTQNENHKYLKTKKSLIEYF